MMRLSSSMLYKDHAINRQFYGDYREYFNDANLVSPADPLC